MSTNNNPNNNDVSSSSDTISPPPPPNPSSSTVPSSFSALPKLSIEQNNQLVRLWKTHNRVLVDVPISYDDQELSSSNNNKKKSLLLPPPFSIDTYNFMIRLYSYFMSYLEFHTNNNNTSTIQQSSTTNHNNNIKNKIFDTSSCLRPFCILALSLIKSSSSATTTASSSSSTAIHHQKIIRLIEGRHVLTFHHEEFMNELNLYENDGNTSISDEFIRKHSFGSFLYFMPNLAIPAIGCSMALAILTAFQKQQQLQLQQQQALLNPNEVPTSSSSAQDSSNNIDRYIDRIQIVIKFIHVYPQIQMMDIKTGLVGKFISLKGHVVKVRPKRLRLATADFVCNNCGSTISMTFDSGKYTIPTKCTGKSVTSSSSSTAAGSGDTDSNDNNNNNGTSCRSKTFTFIRPTARYINVQEIRIQEVVDDDPNDATGGGGGSKGSNMMQAGRTPKQIEVELSHNELVSSCRPGDIVLVAATVAAVNTAVAAGSKGKKTVQETSTYKLYLLGHSITTMSESGNSNYSNDSSSNGNKNKRKSSNQNQHQFTKYTQQQLRNIVQLCHADHKYFSLVERRAFPFDLLVRSLCPSIIGHHVVKAGLLLCLLGGTPTNSSYLASIEKGNSIRSNSHILIVGDPGMGKSQMLLAATQLAARSVYVGGNTSSTTGLTVSLTKEERGETGIEAGALVLADQGICAIDEFDKMAKNHHDGLLEAMEQQQVSIAKAGVVASLPARCSIIAAANPKHGSYDMSRTVAENLNMAKPILSRFDLVFILRDRADKELDRMVSSNIMNLYRSSSTTTAGTSARSQAPAFAHGGMSNGDSGIGPSSETDIVRMPISQRLAWVTEIQKNPLPADLVRDYIAYAREYCKPQLTPEAAEVLKEYYMELRYPSDGKRKRDTVPITTRQLEALIRLCQARAKAALREYVLKEDALDVIELMTISVKDVHRDEEGYVDPCRGGAGGTSNRKMKKAFLNELHRVIGVGAECTLDDMRRIADKVGCGLSEFQSTIDGFRDNGVLMLKSNGKYQILT